MNIANRSVDEQIKESEPNEIDTLCVILVNSILTMMSHAGPLSSEIGTDKVTLIINDEVNREVALYEVRNTKKCSDNNYSRSNSICSKEKGNKKQYYLKRKLLLFSLFP